MPNRASPAAAPTPLPGLTVSACQVRLGGKFPDEHHSLTVLEDSVEGGMTPADELLAHNHGDWNGDLSRIYAEYSS